MAEVLSRQTTKIAAAQKLTPAESVGRKRMLLIQLPAAHAGASADDTFGSGVPLPIGTRFTLNSQLSVSAGTATTTLSIGLRDFATKAVIDATAIASALAITNAGKQDANNGSKLSAGQDYVTTVVAEVYCTVNTAGIPANQQVRAEIEYVTD